MARFFNMMCAAALTVLAGQGPPSQGNTGMGRGMGMMGMMQDPVHQSVFIAFALPEMQSELGLSVLQTTQLKQLKQELLTKGQELSTQISAKRKELEGLVSAGTSKNAEVKQLLEQVANLRAQQEFAAFETAGKMRARLTDQQRAKLAAMRPGEIHQAMMSHLTMAEMAQMMQFMGDAGMMGRGMMGMMSGIMGTAGAPPKQ